MSKGIKTLLIVCGIIAFVVVILAGWFISGYNKAVAFDEDISGKWAQVENQLKRRYDLIPNLVESVKGYSEHEKELFQHLADARTKYFKQSSVQGKVQAANSLEGVLSKLLFLQEKYPDLKANESFLKLQDSLEGTENRISVERKRYNESVQRLNTFSRTFFGRFFTSIAGVEKGEYYQVPEGQEETPQVKF